MPHHTNSAQQASHGYIIRKLNNKANADHDAAALKGLTGLPANTRITTVSVMEDEADPANKGDTVVITVDVTAPAPQTGAGGTSAGTSAHQRVQAVAGLVDASGLTHVVAGLANHWCCYSDW